LAGEAKKGEGIVSASPELSKANGEKKVPGREECFETDSRKKCVMRSEQKLALTRVLGQGRFIKEGGIDTTLNWEKRAGERTKDPCERPSYR